MHFLTDAKRAVGMGAAHAGTEHHWYMTMSSVGLAFLLPVWVWIFGRALGQSREAVIATFGNPFAAILTALILIVGMRHFAKGAQTMLEDYARGTTRRALIIFAYSLSYAVTATGLYALVRIAL